jgi:hypothetical protein
VEPLLIHDICRLKNLFVKLYPDSLRHTFSEPKSFSQNIHQSYQVPAKEVKDKRREKHRHLTNLTFPLTEQPHLKKPPLAKIAMLFCLYQTQYGPKYRGDDEEQQRYWLSDLETFQNAKRMVKTNHT